MTTTGFGTQPLAPEILKAKFAELQERLVPMWEIIGTSSPGGAPQENNTVVVVPSLTIDVDFPPSAQAAYEERMLFMLLLLRQPSLRLIYATSMPIQPAIIDYYLSITPGVIITNARQRLHLVSPLDGSTDSLSEKLLARPRLLQHIRSLIPDPDRAHMVPFLTTDLERELAVKLGIPMYAADPQFWAFGTKTGCRRIFAEEGVVHPIGYENLTSPAAVRDAIADIRAERPTVQQVIVKLNEGVSGMGNAVADLRDLPAPGDPAEKSAIEERLHALQFEVDDIDYAWYARQIEQEGAIVEELISGDEFRSPSAQLRVTPLGEVEMLSTHDQLLGGPSGQSYLGGVFPAHPDYAWPIMRESLKVGQRFTKEGIVGRFALDFVTVRSGDDPWQVYAIEVNLRKGGTTAPFLLLQYLTDGHYNAEEGVFYTRQGQPRCYLASDHVEKDIYRVFSPLEVFDLLTRYKLHYNHTTQTGCVLHMISSVSELGRLGVTCIDESPEAAQALYDRFEAMLDEEAERSALGK